MSCWLQNEQLPTLFLITTLVHFHYPVMNLVGTGLTHRSRARDGLKYEAGMSGGSEEEEWASGGVTGQSAVEESKRGRTRR